MYQIMTRARPFVHDLEATRLIFSSADTSDASCLPPSLPEQQRRQVNLGDWLVPNLLPDMKGLIRAADMRLAKENSLEQKGKKQS
jgi:hypothetical protein